MIEKIAGCSGHDCDWPTCAGCGRKNSAVIFECDSCGRQVNTLYRYNGEVHCCDCIIDAVENDCADGKVVDLDELIENGTVQVCNAEDYE